MCWGLGLVLFVGHLWRMGEFQWEPLEVPLKVEKGFSGEGAFVAEADRFYEVEVKFSRQAPAELLESHVWNLGESSPLDIAWRVVQGDSLIAAGTCGNYLYLHKTGRTFAGLIPGGGHNVKQLVKSWMDAPQFQVSSIGPGAARGIGRFQARAGEAYQLRFEVGKSIERLAPYPAALAVRLDRQFHFSHYQGSMGQGLLGLGAMGAGLLALALHFLLGRKAGSRGGD